MAIALLCWVGLRMIFPQVERPLKWIELMNAEAPERLPVPVAGVRPRDLADTWGAARSGGRRHQGIDIFARRNTPILSTTWGVVVKQGTNKLGGRMITVRGPGRQNHYYAHLESWGEFQKGDWVEAGDTLGFVGNSGNAASTPPHLHYGIYTPKGAINPYPLLRR